MPNNKTNRLKYLVDAGISAHTSESSKDLLERVSTLAWARASLANNDDPDSWGTTLDSSLHGPLLALYSLPPYKGPLPAPSDFVRLAQMVTLFDASPITSLAPAQPSSTAQTGHVGQVINTARGGAPTLPLSSSPALAAGVPNPAPQGTTKKRPAAMMHDDLLVALPTDVYNALDTASHMDPEKRLKFVNACRATGTLLDNTTSAPFGHLMLLSLSEGQHFDPERRGRALAAAGRSAPAGSASLEDRLSRESHIQSLQKKWPEILAALLAPSEISSTHLASLFDGVAYVLTLRAARSQYWGCAEVEQYCRSQLDALPTYRASISANVSRSVASATPAEIPRLINDIYLKFFTPFWWEHILNRGALDATAHKKLVDSFLTPLTTIPPAPPAPAPPPAPTPPPMPVFYPQPPPPWLPYPALPQHPPIAYAPPTQATPPQHPPAPPAAGGGARPLYVGKPLSSLVIGDKLGLVLPSYTRHCTCAISRSFPGKTHFVFECPIRYHATRGQCPGWTAAGLRIPTSWAGDDLTAATQAEWKTFAATLPQAGVAGNHIVNF